MRTLLCVLLLAACGESKTTPSTDAPSDPPLDAAIDAARPNQGACATCTSQMCLPQLQACAGAAGCVDGLIAFNDCLSAQGATCGTMFAAGGTTQGNLWACLSTSCAATCGTM